VPAKQNSHYLIFKSCKSLGLLKQKFYLLLCAIWSVLQYNVRMLIQCMKIVSRYFGPRYIRDHFFRAEIYWGRLLTFITGSSSRLLRILFSADLAMYWFPVCHFRCMKFKPLVIWIWNQNIAISTIVGTSSHINSDIWTY
jgi:hypothetical protein